MIPQRNRGMMKVVFKGTGCVLALLLGSCLKNDDTALSPGPSTTYFVVSNNPVSTNSSRSVVSTFELPAATLTDVVYQPPLPQSQPGFIDMEHIADSELNGDKIYSVRSEARRIDVIDAPSKTLVSSIEYSTFRSTSSRRRITTGGNKVFVSDRTTVTNQSSDIAAFVFAVDLADTAHPDSIPIPEPDAIIWSMAYAKNHLYVSLSEPFQKNRIDVLSTDTYQVVKSFSFEPYLCFELLLDFNNDVLAFTTSDSLIHIDTSTREIKSRRKFLRSSLFVSSSGLPTSKTALGLDKSSNVIYFLSDAPQPATAPWLLYAYDLGNSKLTRLSDKFIAASTMAFDPVHQTILLGLSNKVTVYNLSGFQINSFSVPYFVSEIMVKE